MPHHDKSRCSYMSSIMKGKYGKEGKTFDTHVIFEGKNKNCINKKLFVTAMRKHRNLSKFLVYIF